MADADKFAVLRQQMVVGQLKKQGITDPSVLRVMGSIPREMFVPEDLQGRAYEDGALPIDCQQTISQPLIVAMMSQALQLSGGEHILEIGTGSGYQAAVLSRLATEGDVVSVERHEALSQSASQRLAELGCDNVCLVLGDGSLGWPEKAPYDRIIVTAAAARCPPALWEQLKPGGLMVIPCGSRSSQTLQQITKQPDGQQHIQRLTGCRFVPLIGEGA